MNWSNGSQAREKIRSECFRSCSILSECHKNLIAKCRTHPFQKSVNIATRITFPRLKFKQLITKKKAFKLPYHAISTAVFTFKEYQPDGFLCHFLRKAVRDRTERINTITKHNLLYAMFALCVNFHKESCERHSRREIRAEIPAATTIFALHESFCPPKLLCVFMRFN